MPVLAVASISWCAAQDYQARIEASGETVNFLQRQRTQIETATTKGEYDQLVIGTERVLLGEVTNWFNRRANSGVN